MSIFTTYSYSTSLLADEIDIVTRFHTQNPSYPISCESQFITCYIMWSLNFILMSLFNIDNPSKFLNAHFHSITYHLHSMVQKISHKCLHPNNQLFNKHRTHQNHKNPKKALFH